MDALGGVSDVLDSVEQVKKQFEEDAKYKDRFGSNRFMSVSFKKQIRSYRNSQQRDDDMAATVRAGVRTKMIVSGGVTEVYRYQIPVKVGKRPLVIDPETGEILNSPCKQLDVDEDGNIIKRERERKEDAKRHNAKRSKMELRRLVLSNFENRDKFITLTFRDGSVSDVTDIDACNKAFDKFMKRLRRVYPDVKYCRVIEFQDANGRGAVHYHCILTMPYVPYEKLGEMWGNGFVGINAIEHVDNVGAYIQKYMAKDFDDARLAGKKAYATSQNVVRPIVVYGSEADKLYEKHLSDKLPTFTNSYESEWQGEVKYLEFNENRRNVQ